MQNFLQNNKFLVSVVTLCDNFYSRFKRFLALMFFYKIDFSLKISYVPFFHCYFEKLIFYDF